MITATLLAEVQRHGIQLYAEGATLHYRAPRGALTADLKAELKTHKTKLLTLLEKSVAERIAQDHGLTLADLQQAADTDWADIENDPEALEALANSIQIRRMRERSEVPPHYTATTICAYCGPVPIFAGVAERVAFCPWCFNRVTGLPVPKTPTKTEIQDRGPTMLKRESCDGSTMRSMQDGGRRVGRKTKQLR